MRDASGQKLIFRLKLVSSLETLHSFLDLSIPLGVGNNIYLYYNLGDRPIHRPFDVDHIRKNT